MMSAIRGKDTGIELQIRHKLHRKGFRYRLHDRDLPGRPDLVLPKYQAAIQVNGCFWHGHGCHLFKLPSSNQEFWAEKIQKNSSRDSRNRQLLEEQGWRVLDIWECALRGKEAVGPDEVAEKASSWILCGESGIAISGENVEFPEAPKAQ